MIYFTLGGYTTPSCPSSFYSKVSLSLVLFLVPITVVLNVNASIVGRMIPFDINEPYTKRLIKPMTFEHIVLKDEISSKSNGPNNYVHVVVR